MKLKTLKDIGEQVMCVHDEGRHPDACVTCLKAEAVKWVKAKRFSAWSEEAVCEFFNITEDDLHNENP